MQSLTFCEHKLFNGPAKPCGTLKLSWHTLIVSQPRGNLVLGTFVLWNILGRMWTWRRLSTDHLWSQVRLVRGYRLTEGQVDEQAADHVRYVCWCRSSQQLVPMQQLFCRRPGLYGTATCWVLDGTHHETETNGWPLNWFIVVVMSCAILVRWVGRAIDRPTTPEGPAKSGLGAVAGGGRTRDWHDKAQLIAVLAAHWLYTAPKTAAHRPAIWPTLKHSEEFRNRKSLANLFFNLQMNTS